MFDDGYTGLLPEWSAIHTLKPSQVCRRACFSRWHERGSALGPIINSMKILDCAADVQLTYFTDDMSATLSRASVLPKGVDRQNNSQVT